MVRGSAPQLHGLKTSARRRQAAAAKRMLPVIAAQGRPPRCGVAFLTHLSARLDI